MGGRSGGKMLPDPLVTPDPMVPPRRQCTATAKTTGARCERVPIRGGSVCWKHGGAAPQVQAKAALRLAEFVEPALGRLWDILHDKEVSNADALRAINSILDRTGHKTPDELDIVSVSAEMIDLEALKGMTTTELKLLRPLLVKMLGRKDDDLKMRGDEKGE